ncbi:MAG: stage III sporulation protein SpoIIIAB [Sarcina sp.]
MIKALLLVLVVIICSLIGYIYGEGYKRRFFQLSELKRILIDIENEIIYSYSSLPDTIIKMGERAKEPLGTLFVEIGKKLNKGVRGGVYEAFSSTIEEQREEIALNEDDLNVLLDLSKSLGETDIYGQEQIFRYAKEKVNRAIEDANIEFKRNVKIYRALGFGLGAMLAIFLI